ncbi:MAG: aldehyde ferredoxin oxidoreductase N-terminal domain-containing protein [Candidatus Thorarchaeota archaeon]
MWSPKLVIYDLTEDKLLPKKTIDTRIIENFLGGRGITVYLGYHAIPTDASPRGPDNSVIFGTGILTATNFPSSGMAVATFKSPQTNTLFTSVATGRFGASLKHIGLDFFQILGCAKTPKYILIDEFSDITLENADPIWKSKAIEADKWLRDKHGKDSSIAVIGTSAVNQVTFAGVAVDRIHFFRRGGLGAVLASKNIKAIVITETPEVQKLEEFSQEAIDQFKRSIEISAWYKMLHNRGTFSIMFSVIENTTLPTKNCSRLLQIAEEKISSFRGYGESLKCWQCPVNCHRSSYQDFVALGPNLKIVDIEYIQEAIKTCDQDALDPLSTGAALASLFNIQEDRRKLLDIDLGFSWSNPTIYSLIDKIINREELGDQLSRGEIYLYQQTSEPFPMIKGQMGGMFYYPNILGLSLATGTSPYIANNFRSDYMIFPELLGIPFKLNPVSKRGKVKTIIALENLIAVIDSLVLCSRYLPFLLQIHRRFRWIPPNLLSSIINLIPNLLIGNFGLELDTLQPLLRIISDQNLTFNKLLEIGNRITLLERIFNTRAGMGREEDRFKRFLKKRPDFFKWHEELLSKYYSAKGLTQKGLVNKQTLKKSGLLGLIII